MMNMGCAKYKCRCNELKIPLNGKTAHKFSPGQSCRLGEAERTQQIGLNALGGLNGCGGDK